MTQPKPSGVKPSVADRCQTLPLGMEFRETISASKTKKNEGFTETISGPDTEGLSGGSYSGISAQSVDGAKNGPDKEW